MSRKPFCFLEEDYKTFAYVNIYVEFLKNDLSVSGLDMQIHSEEIQRHIECNNLFYKYELAVQEWIRANGENFRIYLNTIKMMALFIVMDINSLDLQRDNGWYMDFEKFKLFIMQWDKYKENIVDSIHL